MMLRQISITWIAVAAALICTVTDSQTSQAQGFLRRLQDRIQSAVEPPAPTQPAPATRATVPRQPQYAPNSNSTRVQPQREGPPATVDVSKFGNSILLRDQHAPAASPALTDQNASPDRPSLGISVIESKDGVPGLQVASIGTDSLADEAGLKEGDLIIAIDGKPTPAISNVIEYLEGRKSGDRVRATIVRETTTETIMVTLVSSIVATTKPETPTPIENSALTPIDLGVTIEKSPGARGLVVADVAANSPAAAAGLKVGDRIVSIDGRLLVNVEALNREWKNRSNGEELSLQLVRDGKLIVADVGPSEPGDLVKTEMPSADGAGSVLEGFGSVLGGLLGGNSKSKPDSAAKHEGPSGGDASKVKQAGFELETQGAKKKLKSDPPSLEGLVPPPVQTTPTELKAPEQAPTTNDQTIEALREQVRRLEEKLKRLDAKE